MRQAINSKARCVTDDQTLDELRAKEQKKVEREDEKEQRRLERERKKEKREKEKEARKMERERKKEEREKEKEARKQKKGRTTKRKVETRSQKSGGQDLVELLPDLSLSVDISPSVSPTKSDIESEAECPRCGLMYGEDDSMWIQCDNCGLWWDLECSGLGDRENIPNTFICGNCL